MTRIIPQSLVLERAELSFPANCATPIAASLSLAGAGFGAQVELDFLQTGPQSWDIDVETESGSLKLSLGGKDLLVDGQAVPLPPTLEYPDLYQRFADLVRGHQSDVDVAPLQLVADAFLCGRRVDVAPFVE